MNQFSSKYVLFFLVFFIFQSNAKTKKSKRRKKNNKRIHKKIKKINLQKETLSSKKSKNDIEPEGLDYKIEISLAGGANTLLVGVKEISSAPGILFKISKKELGPSPDKGAFDMLGVNVQGKVRGLLKILTPYFYIGAELGYSMHMNYLPSGIVRNKKFVKAPTGFMLHRLVFGLPIFSNVLGDRDGLRVGLIPKIALNIAGSYKLMGKNNSASSKAINPIDVGLGLELIYDFFGFHTGMIFDMFFLPIIKPKSVFLGRKYSPVIKNKSAVIPGVLMSFGGTIGYNLQYLWRSK